MQYRDKQGRYGKKFMRTSRQRCQPQVSSIPTGCCKNFSPFFGQNPNPYSCAHTSPTLCHCVFCFWLFLCFIDQPGPSRVKNAGVHAHSRCTGSPFFVLCPSGLTSHHLALSRWGYCLEASLLVSKSTGSPQYFFSATSVTSAVWQRAPPLLLEAVSFLSFHDIAPSHSSPNLPTLRRLPFQPLTASLCFPPPLNRAVPPTRILKLFPPSLLPSQQLSITCDL